MSVFAFAAVADASVPRSIGNLVTATELTADQRRDIVNYARQWSESLRSDDYELARRAKRQLMEPFRLPGIRRVFRDEYSRAAIPELAKAIESDNTFAAVNAVQVIAEFANDDALRVMRERCDSRREQRWQVRLWASRGLGRVAVASEDIPSRTIDSAVRDLRTAGERESHWLVLQRQFESLAMISSSAAREAQISLLDSTITRIKDDANGPNELMQSVHRSLLLLRDQYLDPNLASAERQSLGTQLAPLLGKVFEIGMMHWESAKIDREVKASYDGAIGLAENLLALVDTQVRGNEPPRTSIVRAWDDGDRSSFEAGVQRWQAVLRNPPYGRR